MSVAAPSIGILRERHLHASLKRWYAEPGDLVELAVAGYIVDLVRGELLIEIQTRGFAGMRPKVLALLGAGHRVRVVHPIAVDRWIVQVDDDGQFLGRRRSPRHGDLVDLAAELVTFPELLDDPGFEIEVLLTREEEVRRHDPRRCWRRRGWTVVERRLIEVIDRVTLARPGDLTQWLPDTLSEPFTTAELAVALHRPRRTAQQLTYCMRRLGVIEAIGMRDRSAAYRLVPRDGDRRAAPATPREAPGVVG
jgi:hypothetical protein